MSCAICALDAPGLFAQPGVFATEGAPRDADGRFRNRYPHDAHASFWLWKWEQMRLGVPPPPPGGWPIPHRKADVERIRANHGEPLATWIGHSSFLVQLAGTNVLIDPHFSPRASPVPFAGPRRVVPLPLEIAELPRVDVVLVTHDHYDHLDRATVKALAAQAGGSPRFLVPLGLAAWFRGEGIERVDELDWWRSASEGGVRFTLAPVQHWSKRTLWDANRTLWGAWAIEGGGLRVLHAGDLGYSRDARDIGERLGPFDLALIPIGAYAPRWFMKTMHIDVAEALQVRRDVRAHRAIGMHWGTFEHLTDEPLDEPPRTLERLRREAGLETRDFEAIAVGDTRVIEPA